MRVSSTAFSGLDGLVELWVELAVDQRVSGSHFRVEANRAPIREALTRHVAVNGVLVTHEGDVSNGGTEVGNSAEDTDADSLVGFVMFGTKAGTYEQDATRGMARNLFVRPAYQDAGAGTRLLAAAEDTLTGAGVDAITLDVLADNGTARRFYRRHDYRPHRVELEKSMRGGTHSREGG